MHEAMFYSKEDGLKVSCRLCHHLCVISDGKAGICNVRVNNKGTLFTLFYGKPIAMAADPIEKKPFFHYKPGSTAFSIATPGCNFQCSFCQNWEISQYGRGTLLRESLQDVSPEEIVMQAKAHHCASISYTYTEPTIFFEYAYDIAKLAKADGISNNFVTNGYITREALDVMKPYLDAANVDLKSFRKDTYRKVIKAELDGVLDSIRYIKELGIWLEVTTLVIPGMNDSPTELKDIAEFLVDVGRDIPWHISRFVPHYKMDDRGLTPIDSLRATADIGRKAGLRYVYLGNVPKNDAECTYCWKCNEKLITRDGFRVRDNKITNRSECPSCRAKIDGVGMGG